MTPHLTPLGENPAPDDHVPEAAAAVLANPAYQAGDEDNAEAQPDVQIHQAAPPAPRVCGRQWKKHDRVTVNGRQGKIWGVRGLQVRFDSSQLMCAL